MDHPDCTATGAENAGSRPAGTEFEIETQRIAQIRKSLTILYRWKDSSYGEGFDVIVYADAVVSLHPTDVSLSKVIVFPSSTRVRAIYTAPVAKSNQASPSARAGGGASLSKTHDLKRPDAVLPPRSGAENLSTLRICLRNVSESDKVSDSDIVLSWIEQDKRYCFVFLCHICVVVNIVTFDIAAGAKLWKRKISKGRITLSSKRCAMQAVSSLQRNASFALHCHLVATPLFALKCCKNYSVFRQMRCQPFQTQASD